MREIEVGDAYLVLRVYDGFRCWMRAEFWRGKEKLLFLAWGSDRAMEKRYAGFGNFENRWLCYIPGVLNSHISD